MTLPDPDLTLFDNRPNNVEWCGVIVRRPDESTYIIEMPNRAPDQTRHFIIATKDVKKLVAPDGDLIIGVVHTHPFRSIKVPSQHDIDSIPEGLIGMVYHPSTSSVVWYDSTGIIEQRLRKRR